MHKKNLGFTLVELVVVIVIITVLSTIGFIAYESYVSDSRDSKRLALLNELRDSLRIYSVEYDLPIPDDAIELRQDGKVFGYQGYIGKTVLETLNFSSIAYDPKDEIYFTYSVPVDRDKFQFLTYLENNSIDIFGLNIEKIHARVNYEKRFPKVFGSSMGIILEQETQVPLQEIQKYKDLGYLDVVTDSGSLLEVYVSDTEVIRGEASGLLGLVPNSTCFTIFSSDPITNSSNGYYVINPSGDKPFLAYCDMDEDGLGHGGGWTFTTFIGITGIARGAWNGTSIRNYRFDREGTGDSYGLDLSEIYHTEAYMVVDTADITAQKISNLEVPFFKYDYKKPILDPDHSMNIKLQQSTRWGTSGDYIDTYTLYGGSNYRNDSNNEGRQEFLYKSTSRKMGIEFQGAHGMKFSAEVDRQDDAFYNDSLDKVLAGPWEKAWYYVR